MWNTIDLSLYGVLSVVFGVPIVVGCFVLAVRACFGKFISAAQIY